MTHADKVIALAKKSPALAHLDRPQAEELARIIWMECEGWDGEYVSPEHVVKCMENRYKAVGLIPSRN